MNTDDPEAGDTELEADLQRLRESDDEEAAREQVAGRKAGEWWARKRASFAWVRAVATGISPDDVDGEPDAYRWGRLIYCAMHGEENLDRASCESLCEEIFGCTYPSCVQVKGFVEGVAKVYALMD